MALEYLAAPALGGAVALYFSVRHAKVLWSFGPLARIGIALIWIGLGLGAVAIADVTNWRTELYWTGMGSFFAGAFLFIAAICIAPAKE